MTNGVRTRSRALRENAPILAPSRLGALTAGDNFNISIISPVEEMMAVDGSPSRMPVPASGGAASINPSGLGSFPATGAGHPRGPLETQRMTDTEQRSLRMAIEVREPSDFVPIESSLVVCCRVCRTIYQRMNASAPPHCPCCVLCARFSPKAAESNSDFTQLRHAVSRCADQIRTLERNLYNLREQVENQKANFERSVCDAVVAARALEQMTVTVQCDSLQKKLAEIENFDISDLVSTCARGRERLVDVQSKTDDLVSAFDKKLETISALVTKAEQVLADSLPKTLNDVCAQSASPYPIEHVVDEPSELGTALIVGDSNVDRLAHLAKNKRWDNSRLLMHGDPNKTFAEHAAFCASWLHHARQRSIVVLHSGLYDILSTETPSSGGSDIIASNICSAIRDLGELCTNTGSVLAVCSIPEVIDYKRRLDWRAIAFDVNNAIKKTVTEIGMRYVDLTGIACNDPVMAINGVDYNRAGLLKTLHLLRELVSPWTLELKISQSTPTRKEARHRERVGIGNTRERDASSAKREHPFGERPRLRSSFKEKQVRDTEPRIRQQRPIHRASLLSGYRRVSRPRVATNPGYPVSPNNLMSDFLDPWLPGRAPWEAQK